MFLVVDTTTCFNVDIIISVSTSDNASRSERSAGQSKGKKAKDGKESRSSKNQPGSRPASQVYDLDQQLSLLSF